MNKHSKLSKKNKPRTKRPQAKSRRGVMNRTVKPKKRRVNTHRVNTRRVNTRGGGGGTLVYDKFARNNSDNRVKITVNGDAMQF